MPLERLDAARFGFDGTCFVCGPDNPRGLQVPYFHDTDHDQIVAYVTLDEHHAGAPTYVHGGVTLAIIDDGMAWACIAIAGKFALTKETSTEFEAPVIIDRPYTLEVRIAEQDRGRIITDAALLDSQRRVCVRANAVMSIVEREAT
jgi:acyl-coenzyme A thioesterase PaaI-like protein